MYDYGDIVIKIELYGMFIILGFICVDYCINKLEKIKPLKI